MIDSSFKLDLFHFRAKLKPFRGLTTKQKVIDAGYNPDNLPLILTFNEARKVDQCMIALDKVVADKCSPKTTVCGSAVLVRAPSPRESLLFRF